MIDVLQLVQSLRYALRDMQGVKISDFELIECINQAASLLYVTMAEKYVRYALKTYTMDVGDANKGVLPDDFLKVHQVLTDEDTVAVPTSYLPTTDGTYRIKGNMFYANNDVYSIEYYYVPKRVKSLSDKLDVQTAMSPYIEQVALAFYGNNLDKAKKVVDICVTSLSDIEVSHFENVGPTQVLGGRV